MGLGSILGRNSKHCLQCEEYAKQLKDLQELVGAGQMSDAVTKVAGEASSLIGALMRAEHNGWYQDDPPNLDLVREETKAVLGVLRELNLTMNHMEDLHKEESTPDNPTTQHPKTPTEDSHS